MIKSRASRKVIRLYHRRLWESTHSRSKLKMMSSKILWATIIQLSLMKRARSMMMKIVFSMTKMARINSYLPQLWKNRSISKSFNRLRGELRRKKIKRKSLGTAFLFSNQVRAGCFTGTWWLFYLLYTMLSLYLLMYSFQT